MVNHYKTDWDVSALTGHATVAGIDLAELGTSEKELAELEREGFFGKARTCLLQAEAGASDADVSVNLEIMREALQCAGASLKELKTKDGQEVTEESI